MPQSQSAADPRHQEKDKKTKKGNASKINIAYKWTRSVILKFTIQNKTMKNFLLYHGTIYVPNFPSVRLSVCSFVHPSTFPVAFTPSMNSGIWGHYSHTCTVSDTVFVFGIHILQSDPVNTNMDGIFLICVVMKYWDFSVKITVKILKIRFLFSLFVKRNCYEFSAKVLPKRFKMWWRCAR